MLEINIKSMSTNDLSKNIFWSGGFFYNEESGKVLLHKRDNNTAINPNRWAFFGGTNEGDESPVDTFIREIYEELNVSLKKDNVIELCNYLNEERMTWRNVFFVKNKLDKSEMKLQEGADFEWVPLNEVFGLDLTELTIRDLKFFREKYA